MSVVGTDFQKIFFSLTIFGTGYWLRADIWAGSARMWSCFTTWPKTGLCCQRNRCLKRWFLGLLFPRVGGLLENVRCVLQQWDTERYNHPGTELRFSSLEQLKLYRQKRDNWWTACEAHGHEKPFNGNKWFANSHIFLTNLLRRKLGKAPRHVHGSKRATLLQSVGKFLNRR